MVEHLPRLVLVPDHLWDAFEGVLADCNITMVSTDGVRSFRALEHHKDCPALYFVRNPERCRCAHLRALDDLSTTPGQQAPK